MNEVSLWPQTNVFPIASYSPRQSRAQPQPPLPSSSSTPPPPLSPSSSSSSSSSSSPSHNRRRTSKPPPPSQQEQPTTEAPIPSKSQDPGLSRRSRSSSSSSSASSSSSSYNSTVTSAPAAVALSSSRASPSTARASHSMTSGCPIDYVKHRLAHQMQTSSGTELQERRPVAALDDEIVTSKKDARVDIEFIEEEAEEAEERGSPIPGKRAHSLDSEQPSSSHLWDNSPRERASADLRDREELRQQTLQSLDPPSLNPPTRILKGRITIFTISGCAHCRTVKAMLKEDGLPFTEINLDVYPERRQELFERTRMRSVPQLFFNEVNVGSKEKFVGLITSGKLCDLIKMVEENEAPDSAPAPPTTLFAAQPGDLASVSLIPICEPDANAQLVDWMRNVPGFVQNRSSLWRSYRKCFIGKEAVDLLLSPASGLTLESREDAVEMGNLLMRRHFFHHVYFEQGFQDDTQFYRFLADEEYSNQTLNTAFASICTTPDAGDLAEQLRRLMLALTDNTLSDDGREIDYAGISQSEAYQRYRIRAAELQRVELSSLSHEEKLAFFINIYNAMVIHATIEVGAPANAMQRHRFFNGISYVIGGHSFSLGDIEHGILRCNRRAPGALRKQFGPKDPRLPLCLKVLEPRIHFALVCGAKSCPPIKTYRASDVHECLTAATQAFFESGGMSLNIVRREVSISRILYWYRADFGGTEEAMLTWIATFIPRDTATLLLTWVRDRSVRAVYQKYDWSTNNKIII